MKFVAHLNRQALIVGVILTLGVAGCAQFPELEAGETPGVAQAAYPKLVPLEQLLDGPLATATPDVQARVEGRADGLRARAARLKQRSVGPGRGISQRVARLRQKAAALRAQ